MRSLFKKNDEITNKNYKISVVEKKEKNCNFTAEFQRNEAFIEEEFIREKHVNIE